MSSRSIPEQIRRNAVALISLFVAVTGLLYNTWRNEHTEDNRNHRWASFEILLLVGELQELVYLSYYDPEQGDDSDFRRAWTKVLIIKDLGEVLNNPVPETANQLHATWGKHWTGIRDHDKESLQEVEDAITKLRADTLMALRYLD